MPSQGIGRGRCLNGRLFSTFLKRRLSLATIHHKLPGAGGQESHPIPPRCAINCPQENAWAELVRSASLAGGADGYPLAEGAGEVAGRRPQLAVRPGYWPTTTALLRRATA